LDPAFSSHHVGHPVPVSSWEVKWHFANRTVAVIQRGHAPIFAPPQVIISEDNFATPQVSFSRFFLYLSALAGTVGIVELVFRRRASGIQDPVGTGPQN
jgi:hypothetical protein